MPTWNNRTPADPPLRAGLDAGDAFDKYVDGYHFGLVKKAREGRPL